MASWRPFQIVIAVLLCGPAVGRAEAEPDNAWFVRTGVAAGHIVAGNPFERTGNAGGDAIDWTPNLTVEIGRHTDGSEPWHGLYGMPSFGFGFSLVSYGNGAASGRPLEAYTFFSWPFARLTDRLALTSDFGMGVSWRWKEHIQATDAYESVLGSDVNARINWGFYLRYLAASRVTLYTGLDFTHRSNGGMVQPDLGINVIGPKASLEYNFGANATTRRRRKPEPPPFEPGWEFLVGGAGGVKNVIQRSSPMVRADFGAFDATAAIERHFYRFGKLGGGADLTYDGSTGLHVDGDKPLRAAPGQRWSVGVYGGYEHVIGRLGALVHAGSTVATGFDASRTKHLYSRYGWRHRLSDRVWSSLTIRAYGFRTANVLEVGAGYRFGRE